MMQVLRLWLVGSSLAAALLQGCGTTLYNHEIEKLANSKRAALIWDGDEDLEYVAMCLEYATAAGEENTTKIDLSGTFGKNKSASLSYQAATKLAQIYNVSDIMQFGHAALYRLCEARANGFLSSVQYASQLQRVMFMIHQLLITEVSGSAQSVHGTLDLARAKVTALKIREDDLKKELASAEADLVAAAPDPQKKREANPEKAREANMRVQDRAAELQRVTEQLREAEDQLDKLRKDILGETSATIEATTTPMPKATKAP